MIDALWVAVDGLWYFQSEGRPLPSSLTIRWYADRHPCDDVPYLAHIDFEQDEVSVDA